MEWEALRPGVAFEWRIYNIADGPLDRKGRMNHGNLRGGQPGLCIRIIQRNLLII